ncbi:MAG: glycosyltransferase family 2 protein [Ruminococcus sp.]|nr:glycosyltransferase family 2 protein [Ruminococcus sp.]
MKSQPLVSVVIPVYNAENYIRTCIEQILSQTYKNMEIIFVDDGSTDNSRRICLEYADKDSRIVVYSKENGGVSSARNMGIEKATGDFLLFLDSDDWLENDAISKLVSACTENTADVVIFEYSVDYPDGRKVVHTHKNLEGKMSVCDAVFHSIVGTNRFVWSKFYKRSAIKNIRFDETIHHGEDTLFACLVMAECRSAYFLAEPLYRYVQSENSATRKSYFNKRLLSGREAYLGLVNLCKEKFPEITDVAVSSYLEILMMIIMYMYKEPKKYKGHIKEFAREIRSNRKTIYKCKSCPKSTKLKVALCSVSPTLMVWFRKLTQKRFG